MKRFSLLFLLPTLLLCLGGIYLSTYLPFPKEYLAQSQLPGKSLRILDRHGILLREVPAGDGIRSRRVKLAEISPYLVKATLLAEDKRFYSHHGVDPLAIARAAGQNLISGHIVSGASTLTQQVVRNLLHYPQSYGNKLLEMEYALRLEHVLSKDEILTLYLNIAPYGNQALGAEAASWLYLDKPAAHLSPGEAAFLAAIPQSPSAFNPYANREGLLKRRDRILKLMLEDGSLTQNEYQAALQSTPILYRPDSTYKAPHFVDWVLSRTSGTLRRNGGQVRTTLDLPLQEKVAAMVERRIKTLQKEHVTNGSVIVMDNATGDILVMVGSSDYFNPEGGQVNGALAVRQPGSSIKPLMYALALENGYTPASLLADVETHLHGPWGDYMPNNYDNHFHGPVLLRTALASSFNIPATKVLYDLGVEPFLDRLHRMEFRHLDKSGIHYGPGLALGNGEATLLEMTRAYAALAKGGVYQRERILLTEAAGRKIRVYSPEAAYLITHILADPAARAPGFGRRGPLEMGMAVAAKTGTTSDFRDNWALGYSREYTVGVWVGNFDGSSMEGISGVTGAAPILRDLFLELYKDRVPPPFEVPKNIVFHEVCSLSGSLPGPGCKSKKLELFIRGKEPRSTCTIHRLVQIDARNDLLAGEATPPENREERIYEVYPSLLRGWALAQGIPEPPRKISMADGKGNLEILYPRNGDTFRIDPNLPLTHQAVPLKLLAGPGVEQVTWFLDGKALATVNPPFESRFQILPGVHELLAEGESKGQRLRSVPVRINILP